MKAEVSTSSLNDIMFMLLLFFLIMNVRTFLVEPFRNPSGAMIPTILVGDFFLVNKFVYGLGPPFVHTRVLNVNDPKRGEVVVFRYPENPSQIYTITASFHPKSTWSVSRPRVRGVGARASSARRQSGPPTR